MGKTFSRESAPDVTCPECGSVYSVVVYRSPARDSDHFDCQVCGTRIQQWNSTACPSYTLKERGSRNS